MAFLPGNVCLSLADRELCVPASQFAAVKDLAEFMVRRKKSVIVDGEVFGGAPLGCAWKARASWAAAMKQIFLRWSAGLVVIFSLSLPHAAQAEQFIPITDPSLCLDGMETVPINDDLEPIPISVEGGCTVPEAPISI
jgi:hypothetical protein